MELVEVFVIVITLVVVASVRAGCLCFSAVLWQGLSKGSMEGAQEGMPPSQGAESSSSSSKQPPGKQGMIDGEPSDIMRSIATLIMATWRLGLGFRSLPPWWCAAQPAA